jgi:tripartite-type tricarboxylate transporter receptor subunit TctC
VLKRVGYAVKLSRRTSLGLATGAAALAGFSRSSWALGYPTRPVHIVVAWPAGINPDIIARTFAQSLSERIGQQFIVDNRPGVASTIGTEFVVRAPPDGYTLLALTSTNTINATLYEKLSYDFARDIAPIAGTARLPGVMAVTPSFPAKTVPEFIAYAKANPGKVTMASGGTGSFSHVAGELFKAMTGVDLLHVPYRGNYLSDLLAGHVQISFGPIGQSIQYARAGQLRALAMTGMTRMNMLPDLPTIAEFVPGYEAYAWDGIGAPKDTPADVVDKLNRTIGEILAEPGMQARLANLGAEPMPMTSDDLGKFIASETEKWGNIIRFAGIKLE